MAGITVAVVGLGFGQDFVPLYLRHPDVADVVLVEPDDTRRREVATRFGLADGYAQLDNALADEQVDAVHILAPVFLHADMVVAAMEAGKHVACAVPMATTFEDIDRILAVVDRSGLTYMMMETTVFAREYFALQEMHETGELGALALYRGFHIQNLDGFPTYWQGFPPMHYITHAIAPILALLDTSVASVQCHGTGRLTTDRTSGGFNNPYPTEVGLFTLRDSDVIADITMSFFQTARSYIEGFAVYGDKRGIEWPSNNEGPLTLFDMTKPEPGHRGNPVTTREYEPNDKAQLLPPSLRQFVRSTVAEFAGGELELKAHHGGSHPYLVHEFVSSIVEQRAPLVGARQAAAWTAPGICAHQSALDRGRAIDVPRY